LLQLSDQLGRFGPMEACPIDHQDDTAFSSRRALKALIDQPTESLGCPAQRANAHDLA
jgi:hypothetical protein